MIRLQRTAAIRILLWLVVCGAPCWLGCAHKGKSSTTAPSVPLTGSNLGSANNGRAIFTGQCGACHAVPTITSYSAGQWSGAILPSMAAKANLSSSDAQDLAAYIASVLQAGSK